MSERRRKFFLVYRINIFQSFFRAREKTEEKMKINYKKTRIYTNRYNSQKKIVLQHNTHYDTRVYTKQIRNNTRIEIENVRRPHVQ